MPREDKSSESSAVPRFLAVLFGAIFLALSGLSIYRSYQGLVATDFTRVGGATRVETALESTRLWARPTTVVVVSTEAGAAMATSATSCAMRHDGPVVYLGGTAAQQQAVVEKLRILDKALSPRHLQLALFGVELPATSDFHPLAGPCASGGDAEATRNVVVLSQQTQGTKTFARDIFVATQPSRSEKLPSTIVVAAAKSGGDAPDIPVAMAVAAHLTHVGESQKIGLLIVPPYLEADPTLRLTLTKQPVVDRGLIIGGPLVVPDSLQANLRKLLPQQQSDLSLWRRLADDSSALILALFAAAAGGGAVVAKAIEAAPNSSLASFFSRHRSGTLEIRRSEPPTNHSSYNRVSRHNPRPRPKRRRRARRRLLGSRPPHGPQRQLPL